MTMMLTTDTTINHDKYIDGGGSGDIKVERW
jgi:hypothetical protein